MPEGVEVTILCKKLTKSLLEPKPCSINNIKILSGRYMRHGPPKGWHAFKKALPLKLKKIENYGKFIYFTLEDDWYILITLGMTGVLSVHDKPNKHDHILFDANCLNFYFNDLRNFGTIQFTKGNQLLTQKLKFLGPDPLERKISYKSYQTLFDKFNPKTLIGDLLLEQNFFAGIGNYLRSDMLYCARIYPGKPIGMLTNPEKKRLYNCIYEVSRRSYKILSKELKNIPNTETGNELKYGNKFLVYKQKFDAKGNPVVRMKMKNGRSIWYVPKIQKQV